MLHLSLYLIPDSKELCPADVIRSFSLHRSAFESYEYCKAAYVIESDPIGILVCEDEEWRNARYHSERKNEYTRPKRVFCMLRARDSKNFVSDKAVTWDEWKIKTAHSTNQKTAIWPWRVIATSPKSPSTSNISHLVWLLPCTKTPESCHQHQSFISESWIQTKGRIRSIEDKRAHVARPEIRIGIRGASDVELKQKRKNEKFGLPCFHALATTVGEPASLALCIFGNHKMN